ncbi:class II aldolase/adducin family protein, partial [Solemya elarraichensis gill symbiont]
MGGNNETEGVTKYRLDFQQAPLPQPALALQLEPWRQRLCALGLIGGNNPARYDGLGFGNLSHRIKPGSSDFVISGTQTGHLEKMGSEAYALVTLCDPASNTIRAQGETPPSSEAMTHAAIYSAAPGAQAVI